MEVIEDDRFFKHTENISDTLVLVGNGAIQNGFIPLRNGLDKWIVGNPGVPPIVEQLRRQDSEAYHQLAILSYKFKFGRASVFKDWKSGACTPIQTEKTGFHNTIKGFLSLRSALAHEFLVASGALSVRWSPEIEELIGEDAAYSTTNWDMSLWNDIKIKNMSYLHGMCIVDHSMVFPTELLIEDTAYDLHLPWFQGCSPGFYWEVMQVFRYASMKAIFTSFEVTKGWLQNCKKLVIWGYSLGDYDADINSLIATYLSPNASELIVINPDPAAFRRAVALTGITNAVHFDPVTRLKSKLI